MPRYWWCIPSSSSDAVIDQSVRATDLMSESGGEIRSDTCSQRHESWRIENILQNGPPVEDDWWTSPIDGFGTSSSMTSSSDERSVAMSHSITGISMKDEDDRRSTTTTSNSTLSLCHDGEERNKDKKHFRNIGKEYFDRVRMEWTKSDTTTRHHLDQTSSSISYDRLVKVFIANVNANRNAALPQPLSLVDAVEILSASWESDAVSSDD